ncbi:MAG: carbohydrate ABC transporter permease, partial [Eubacteriales bacterium]|nr:carbohydrate ABC transporter permease [Eubacteriales bacterium]
DVVVRNGYSFFPQKWSVDSYVYLFRNPQGLINAYKVTIITTLATTVFGLFLTAMTGYALSWQDFRSRNVFSFMFYFTQLFGGGLIPWYMVITQYLGMRDTMWALIVPSLLSSYNILLMRNFIKQCVPNEVVESDRIDGAGDLRIFVQIVLRLATPALATIGLFIALGKWNDWYSSMLFIKTESKHTLQYYLYRMVNMSNAIKSMQQAGVSTDVKLPSETLKMAMAIVATGPVVLVYPFVQRYFVKGLTVGAVKG